MPQLVRCRRLVPELIGSLDDHEGRVGDQVVGLEQTVDGRFRDEVAPRVGERHGQFPVREFRLVQGYLHDLPADIVRDTVPYPARATGAVLKSSLAKGSISVIPSVKRRCRDAELVQRPPDREVGSLDQADDHLLGENPCPGGMPASTPTVSTNRGRGLELRRFPPDSSGPAAVSPRRA